MKTKKNIINDQLLGKRVVDMTGEEIVSLIRDAVDVAVARITHSLQALSKCLGIAVVTLLSTSMLAPSYGVEAKLSPRNRSSIHISISISRV